MSESYEIVLQQVAKGELYLLLKFIEMGSQALSGLSVSEDFGGSSPVEINQSLIDAVVAHDGDVCLSEQLHEFKVSQAISLPLVLLRVIKYEDKVDVELSFNDAAPFDIDRIMLTMQGYSHAISNKFHIKEFYGGLEPASDIDTRYFTGDALGPLS